MDMSKTIKVTKSQLKQMIKESLAVSFDPNQLPKYSQEVVKLIHDGKKFGNQLLNIIKNLSIAEILNDVQKYQKMFTDVEAMASHYYKKSNQYYDIHSALEGDEENEDAIEEYYHLVSDLDTVATDLDDMKDMFENIMEMVTDAGGQIKDKMTYFDKQYPTQTINVGQPNKTEEYEN
jgi:DNA repair ATPase RecN